MQSNSADYNMIKIIAANIPENNAEDLIAVYEHFRAINMVPFPLLKEVQTAGIPILETLADIMDMPIYHIAVLSRFTGIEFQYIEQAFKNLTVPGSKFHLKATTQHEN